MAALTSDRSTVERDPGVRHVGAAANVRIFAGALVVANATGTAEPGRAAVGLTYLGRAAARCDNTGQAANAQLVPVERGCFQWAGDGSITVADRGRTAYVVDDQTVALTDGGGTRSPAGLIFDVDAAGVWISN